jgi:two-component system, sensor histidine kinase and response regulator
LLTERINNHSVSAETEIKILLVDDREDNLVSMEIVLEKQGYTFFKATSGTEALKILLKEDDFSLILLDVRMPIMDGYETAELIYQREKLRTIPIIFITGQDYEETAMFKGYQAGAVDYIRKPINPQILRSKVSVFTDLYKKNQLLKRQEEKLRLINDDLMQLNRELEDRVRDRTTELEKLNAELKELNHSKDKFLSVISHDLRNPLTALLASSEKLNKKIGELKTDDIRKLSSIVHRTSNKILEQFNELVEWARKQQDKATFSPQRLQLLQGIAESLELLRSNAQQKKISIRNEIEDSLHVNADPLMLRSILQNLVTNAIKFTPQGGTIGVSATRSDNMIEICIRDSGVGMSAEKKEALFSSSSETSPAVGTNKERGTGLGLLLVRDFVLQHGGIIKVESEEGKGSCFKFTVPAS